MMNGAQNNKLKRFLMPALCRRLTAAVILFCSSFVSYTQSSTVSSNSAVVAAFLSSPAKHIVSLSPAATETLCAVGAFSQIAARTSLCDFPPEVADLPCVGGFDGKTISIEKIVSFHPDLVYATAGMHDYLAPLLKEYGINLYLSNASSIESVCSEITDMGKITGHIQKAEKLTAHIKSIVSGIQSRISGKNTPSVYWEIWNSPYMSAGSTSFMNGLIKAAGGANVFSDITQAYPLVSEETIIARKPDVIIIPDMENESLVSIHARPGWKIIPAVHNKRVYFVNADLTARPGPRIGEAVLQLAKSIHPDISFEGIE